MLKSFLKFFRLMIKKLRTKLDGFMMIEVMMYIFVASSVLFLSLRVYLSALESYRNQKTIHQLKYLTESIKRYAYFNGHLPYPSQDLNGNEGPPYITHKDISQSKHRGYIPYKSLGIDKQYAIDGHGRAIKYYAAPCILPEAGQKYHTKIAHSLAIKESSLLMSHPPKDLPSNMQYDIEYFPPNSYLKLVEKDGSVIDIIRRVPAENIIKFGRLDSEIFKNVYFTDLIAFIIVADGNDFQDESMTIYRGENIIWVSRFELAWPNVNFD